MTCDLGVVLEIAGGLSATALAFIVCPTRVVAIDGADDSSPHQPISF
jgi:hypothetical protein